METITPTAELRQDMLDTINQIRSAHIERARALRSVSNIKLGMARRSATVLVTGSYEGKPIRDAKPEAIRDAMLTAALEDDEVYSRKWDALLRAEIDLDTWDADLEQHRNTLAMLRAEARLLAAEMGGER